MGWKMRKTASNLREAQANVIDEACEAVVLGKPGSVLSLIKACSFGQTIVMAQQVAAVASQSPRARQKGGLKFEASPQSCKAK